MNTQVTAMKLADEFTWIDGISKTSNVDRSAVEDILRRHGIRAQATVPRARKVAFTSISFSGEKEEIASHAEFQFNWQGLGPGLWAVMSDVNNRGKSSILNILKAALQGDFPNNIKPDIWRWLSKIDVDLRIDLINYRVSVEKQSGDQSTNAGQAKLSRQLEDDWTTLYEGDLPGLKGHVEDLFMEELGFTKIYAVNDSGTLYEHSWPAVASALFIGGNTESKAIFGELVVDGLPLRLLQLYIGLPWISTLTAITTAKKILAPTSRPFSDPLVTVRKHLKTVEEEIAAIRSKVPSAVERVDLRHHMTMLDTQLAEKQAKVGVTREALQLSIEALDRIRAEQAAQACLVQALSDERDAGYVFRNLRPERCPACEADFRIHPVQHKDENCILCKSALTHTDEVVSDDRLQAAAHDLEDINNVLKGEESKVSVARRELNKLTTARDALSSELEAAQNELRENSDDSELRFAELNATAKELKALLGSSDSPDLKTRQDKAVLDAAEKQTRELIDGLQTEILNDVADAIMRLSTTFGVRNLTEATLNGQGHLKLIQGGADTSFSKLTKGERLRVKIAAALAVVEVARARGLGRHPGLLILDSPGAEEVVDSDFHEMLANVSRVAQEMGGVQVLIGTIYRKELEEVVPHLNRRHAQGDAPLF